MRKLMEAVEQLDSNKLEEGASSRQWEIAINNLIGEGDELWDGADSMERGVWEWVREELHGMLDFQPDEDDGGDGNTISDDQMRRIGIQNLMTR